MSIFIAPAKHPVTGEIDPDAVWLDDYFGRHRYGVRFSDGKIFPEDQLHQDGQADSGILPDDTLNGHLRNTPK